MALNSNYASFIAGFDAGNYFEAADGGQFNGAEFGASVLAYPSALWLQDTSVIPADEEQWWGNLDEANNNGWSIGVGPRGALPQQLYLLGRIGTGAAIVELSYLLSDSERAAFTERMLHVQLWRKDGVGYLAVNGNIVASAAVAAYGASANAPTLGSGAGGDRYAGRTWVGGASYYAGDLGGVGAANPVGSAWQTTVAAWRVGYLQALIGGDWPHRYDLATSMLLGASGTIAKSAAGAQATVLPAPPASLPDLGNLGPTVLDAAATPVALTRVGVTLVVFQLENAAWYEGGGAVFGAADAADRVFLGVDVITATNAAWPVPADTTFIEYEIIGGGGGGGGVAGDAAEAAGAGGGGSGAYTAGTAAVVPGSTLAITIGAAGAAGAAGANNGGAGGTSSIGAITAPGGSGGVGVASAADAQAAAGGAGGVAGVGGSYMEPGAPGAGGVGVGAGLAALSGAGGPSAIAGGAVGHGLGAAGAAIAGIAAAANSGAGGSGAAACADGDVAGGAGGSGVVIIRRYGS